MQLQICVTISLLSDPEAHTRSNKLVSKVSAQKKGEKSYDSYKYVFKFRWFQVESPLNLSHWQIAEIA